MNQKNIFISVVVILLIGIIGYFVLVNNQASSSPIDNNPGSSVSNQPAVQNPSLKEKILEITLEINAPFSTAELTIYEDGSALYTAKQRGQQEAQTSHETGTFTKEQIVELFDLIERNTFFSLADRPKNQDDPEDGSTYTISVITLPADSPELVDTTVYTVSCYQFSCEQKFLLIKNFIIQSYGKEILEVGV